MNKRATLDFLHLKAEPRSKTWAQVVYFGINPLDQEWVVWRSGEEGKTTDEQSHDQGHCLRAELIVCQKNRRQEGLAFINQPVGGGLSTRKLAPSCFWIMHKLKAERRHLASLRQVAINKRPHAIVFPVYPKLHSEMWLWKCGSVTNLVS